MEKPVRNQHYVPRFYLNGFADDCGRVYVSRKSASNGAPGEPFRTNVEHVCSKRDYYEVEERAESGVPKYVERGTIEEGLSRIESAVAPHIATLRNVEVRDKEDLPPEAVNAIPYAKLFLANVLVRNPMTLDDDRAKAKSLADRMIGEDFFSKDELNEMEGLGYTPESTTEFAIVWTTLQSINKGTPMAFLLDWLEDMGTVLIKAITGTGFITTDVPLACGWKSLEDKYPLYIYMPLDSRTAIMFHTYDKLAIGGWASTQGATEWNQFLLTQSDLWNAVIAERETTLKSEIDGYRVKLAQHILGSAAHRKPV